MKKTTLSYIAVVLAGILLSGSVIFDSQSRKAALSTLEKISSRNLYQHLAVLTSDSLQGRETTFPGQKKAAAYIAGYFSHLGLQPGGDNGSYLQSFPVTKVIMDSSSSIAIHSAGGNFAWRAFGKEYLPYSLDFDTTITAAVEFVGYGADIPNAHFFEYDSSTDYSGKIVVALEGSPWENDTTELSKQYAKHFTINAKCSNAVSKNAAGLIIIHDEDTSDFQDSQIPLRDMLLRGRITLPKRLSRNLPIFNVTRQIGNSLLQPCHATIAYAHRRIDSTQRPWSFPLKGIVVTLTVHVDRSTVITENVIGVLPGTDPVLKNEFVLLSAHYDHLGMNLITYSLFPGADDDGSGTAAILELARVFASSPSRRSMIFMTVAGEEKGLLGSLYYTEHPDIPLENTVCDLNIDMIGRTDPAHSATNEREYIYLIGDDKMSSDLHSLSESANDESDGLTIDYTYNDDNEPNHFYRRSDHYNFVKHDIPVIFYFNGTHEDYHQSTDTIDKIDFALLRKRTQLIWYTAWKISEADKRPRVDRGSTLHNGIRQ